MTIGTKAIEVDCPTCHSSAGERCREVGSAWLDRPLATSFHQVRIDVAAKATRDDNARARRSR